MPAPFHYRVTYSGVLGDVSAPVEIWSNTFAFAPPTQTTLGRTDMPALASSMRAIWQTRLAPLLTSQVRLTRTRVASVNAGGKVERDPDGAYVQGDDNTAAQGASSTNMPLATTLAVTWRSALIDSTGRGRIFLPCPSLGTIDKSGLISTATAAGIATACANIVRDVNALTNIGDFVIASGGSATKAINPALRPVIAVAVGRVPDVQTRRRNALEEGYSEVTV